VVLAVVAGLSYTAWILEFLLSPDIDVVDGYVSELSARGRPYRLVFSAGDFTTGVLTVGVALAALLMLRRRPWAVAGWSALGLFGLWAIADSVFSMDCAPSIDTSCALRERADRVSFSHQFHSVTSSLVIFFGIAALLALSIAARRYGWWPALARWGWLLALTEAVLSLGTLALMYFGVWLGLAQRFQISVLCMGLLVIAGALCTDWTAHRQVRGAAARGRPTREKAGSTPP
jgi:small-conductance mechanosensitive channel